ncbi:MAG: hypothetical protein DWQ05_06370 [Calditrichaeota bacterium]|nr:MAG: hypothetical protein DWQ05_06370 [Calditrichota bacterium]
MWIKAQSSELFNLNAIESLSLVAKDKSKAIVAMPSDKKDLNTRNGYVLFTGSAADCEITLAEIEAAIVGNVDFLEL